MGTRLSSLDLAFLGLESQRTPVNVAALQIFEIPQGYRGNFVRDLIFQMMELEPGPPFNVKLSSTHTVNLPSWVHDEDFDLGYHVRHSAVPKPGTMKELMEVVSRLHSRIMDRERPLWEFHVIEGLRNRQFAVYFKMHHSAVDGMGGVAILEGCMTQEPTEDLRAPWQELPKPKQSAFEMNPMKIIGSAFDGAVRQLNMGRDLGRILLGHGAKLVGLQPADSPVPFTAPKSIFNVRISGARRFFTEIMSLSEVKSLAKQSGSSVNDVVLAICGGALRRYLLEKDALPDQTLVATVPVSIRQINRAGNAITYVSAKLGTEVEDPMQRLLEIRRSTHQAKAEVSEVAPEAAVTFAVMAQGLVGVLNKLGMHELLPPPANVVVSNVPGPRNELFFGKARLLANYPMSVLVDGQALNITVMSYCDEIDIGVMACRHTLPDVEILGRYMHDAKRDLEKAVARSGGKARARRTKAKKLRRLSSVKPTKS